MDFTHPLARGAKVWTARFNDGETRRVLIVVTNAELDPGETSYNPENVERLSSAAQEFLQETGAADGFILSNRMRDWENSRDR